jgi:hypothetical protein
MGAAGGGCAGCCSCALIKADFVELGMSRALDTESADAAACIGSCGWAHQHIGPHAPGARAFLSSTSSTCSFELLWLAHLFVLPANAHTSKEHSQHTPCCCRPLACCCHSLQVFDRFDGDGSGRISRSELLELVGKHGPGMTSELDEEVRTAAASRCEYDAELFACLLSYCCTCGERPARASPQNWTRRCKFFTHVPT